MPAWADPPASPWTLRELLHRALDEPPEARCAFLAPRLPAGVGLDEALALLDGAERVGEFLEEPLLGGGATFRPALPERVGPYAVERVLGFGSMGVVYLARQAAPARRVAVKLLRVDHAGPDMAERFRRECDALARLAHASIARVYDAGTIDLGAGLQPWFAMEYIDGADLATHVEGARLDRRGRVRLVVETARAVEYAHRQGIVHRDLKPENVLVRPDGSVSVVDFGVAQLGGHDDALRTLTVTGQVVGTLSYMAPEQARGGSVSGQADQFALAAILYELLTGELPFDVRGRLVHDALRVVADGVSVPASRRDPTLAGDLEAILGTALSPEPNRRYPSVGAFADDLERWLAGGRVTARRRGVLDGLARLIRRRPLAALASVAALGLVGSIATLAVDARLDGRRARRVASLFADRALLAELRERQDALWPVRSALLPALDAWLAEADGLAARRDEQARVLAALRAGSLGDLPAMLGADAAHGRSRRLDDEAAEYLAELDALLAAGGPRDQLAARRATAARILQETVANRAQDWAAAAARVRADARFADFALAPVEGLVPLGPDPSSGLEEFAVFTTGALPVRAAPTAAVAPRAGDAVVLVLVPGGDVTIGGQDLDPGAPNFVSPGFKMGAHCGPPRPARLDPFLIAKYEATQDLWLRLAGANPSYYEPGHVANGVTVTLLHPVETVTWEQAIGVLRRHGLTLPTEAQWEVAARGGSPFACVTSNEPSGLFGFCNFRRDFDSEGPNLPPYAADGHGLHWPIGSGQPNGYGLHDVFGNVWELCLDTYKVDYHRLPLRDGDGLVLAAPDGDVSRRGGCFTDLPAWIHLYRRHDKRFDGNDAVSGVRPAMSLVTPRQAPPAPPDSVR